MNDASLGTEARAAARLQQPRGVGHPQRLDGNAGDGGGATSGRGRGEPWHGELHHGLPVVEGGEGAIWSSLRCPLKGGATRGVPTLNGSIAGS